MKMNKTTRYILLFVAALLCGMALKNVFSSSMIVTLGLAVGLLVGAIFSMNK